MKFLIGYDIAGNRVRSRVAKYLEGREDAGGGRGLRCGIAAMQMRHTRRGVHKNADKIKC